ncbi:hypothetical protein DTO166G4_5448 [Paecilomyces variotii]|nr:hypothetical protein DTO166G4_5448 [Paecilomyces variotii]KAJ9236137.1 hypothetical protein DTO166G5_4182 [Paecilomyces variotii]KAJ9254749.1 hypothetical protein DTO195F2_6505 [Paecilomyces variotii]KAJ9366364.1 hypothetical protein DTO282E5_8929 [Paecilomyces variotii]
MTSTLSHPPASLGPLHPAKAQTAAVKPSVAKSIGIRVKDPLDHEAPAILHEPRNYNRQQANESAVVLISGAGGGVSGPAGIYPSLADKFSLLLNIPCIRLDYRQPAREKYCTADVIAAFDYLATHYSSKNFVIVGWSFGGSPCFTVAAREPERVRGVATVASQTAGTDGVRQLSPRPVLLLHGTGDTCLSPACSQTLFRQYGEKGERELKLFEGDDHGLSRNAVEVERLIFHFAARCLGLGGMVDEPMKEEAAKDLVGSRKERVSEMQEGHDLEGGERL